VKVFDLAGNEVYRLDFAWTEVKVAVEYDGYEAHEGRAERDGARDDDLRRRGWVVLRADVTDLKDPGRLVAAVRAAFRARGLAT
jgi:very-short-patch-repair endonuclease